MKIGSIILLLAALLAFATLPENRVTLDNVPVGDADLATRMFARISFALADQTITHLGIVKIARIVLLDGDEIYAIGLPFVGRYYAL